MLYPSISAVFSRGNFDCGGRLYSIVKRGIGWQNLSQEERHTITINGESTVELDFKALHISMLYAIMGIQIREDPYTYFSTEMRSLYKTLMLRLLNARSIRGTLQSIERTLWTLKRKPFILSKEMKILNAVEKFKPNWNKLVSELMEHHRSAVFSAVIAACICNVWMAKWCCVSSPLWRQRASRRFPSMILWLCHAMLKIEPQRLCKRHIVIIWDSIASLRLNSSKAEFVNVEIELNGID